MGTYIAGWVECRLPFFDEPSAWDALISLDFLSQNYDMFDCLFGVRNFTHFRPIAGIRGTPGDISLTAQFDESLEGADSRTWISWQEIKNIDWEEEAEGLDDRITQYKKPANGEFIPVARFSYNIILESLPSHALKLIKEGGTWEQEDLIFKKRKARRKEALDKRWELLFDMMQFLANKYGDENVRMIAWFT